jgi:hypothetical protein
LWLIGVSCVIALIAILFFKDMEKNYIEGLDAFSKSNGFTSSIKGRIVLNEFVRFASLRDEKHTLMYARQEEFKSKYFTQGQIQNMSPSQTRRSHWILLRLEIDDAELKAKLEAQSSLESKDPRIDVFGIKNYWFCRNGKALIKDEVVDVWNHYIEGATLADIIKVLCTK